MTERSILIAAGVVAAWLVGSHWLTRWRLARLIARLDATDPGWATAHIDASRAAVPDAANGAYRMVAVYDRLGRPPTGGEDEVRLNLLSPHEPLTADDRSRFAARLGNGEAREFARTLADFPAGEVRDRWGDDPLADLGRHNDRKERCYAVHHYLRDDFLDVLDRGHVDEAGRSWLAGWNCGQALGTPATNFALLVRAAMRRNAYRRLDRLLTVGGASEPTLAALQNALDAAAHADDPFAVAVRGERGFINAAALYAIDQPAAFAAWSRSLGESWEDRLERLLLKLPGRAHTQRFRALRVITAAVVASRLPDRERERAMSNLARLAFGKGTDVRRIAANTAQIFHVAERDRAFVRCAIAALACARYRLRLGRLPTTLDDVVAAGLLAAAPADPFAAGPLRLIERDGFVTVTSAGHDPVTGGAVGMVVGPAGEAV